MVAAILRGVARVHHHHGFKAAWQDCGAETVVKHLDWDAPALQARQGANAQAGAGEQGTAAQNGRPPPDQR